MVTYLPAVHLFRKLTNSVNEIRLGRATDLSFLKFALPHTGQSTMSGHETDFILLGAKAPSSLPGWVSTAAVVLALIFIISRSSAIFSTRKFRADNHCKDPPAYPQKDPFFALDLVFQALSAFRAKRFLDMITERHTRVGPTYSARSMSRRYLFTSDPENIKTVLSVRFKDYCLGERSPIMGPLLGRGIFVTDGDEWAHSRAVLRPNFVKDQVADLELVDKHIDDLLRLIRADSKNSKTIDLAPLFMRFTLDTATEFLFNQSTNTLRKPGQAEQDFSAAFQISLNEIATLFRLGPFWKLRRMDKRVLEAHRVCRAYVDRFAENAVVLASSSKNNEIIESDDKSRNYFLKELAQTTADKDKICDELLNILIAGRDTAASLLSSLFHALARNPEAWAKVREEVRHFNGQLPTYEQLRDLKYAKHCINESN